MFGNKWVKTMKLMGIVVRKIEGKKTLFGMNRSIVIQNARVFNKRVAFISPSRKFWRKRERKGGNKLTVAVGFDGG